VAASNRDKSCSLTFEPSKVYQGNERIIREDKSMRGRKTIPKKRYSLSKTEEVEKEKRGVGICANLMLVLVLL
jgi:hypothetical protein